MLSAITSVRAKKWHIVCHGSRLTKKDDFFQIKFDHFYNECRF